MSETVLERLLVRLTEAFAYNANAHVAPVALLWPDGGSQWVTVVDRIRERLPFVSLGDYEPDARRGPAYWVRCVVMGTVDAGLPDGLPIVYLPGIGRSELRAVEACPPEEAPIAELQYRCQWFSHPNGRDWTVRSFLVHDERGLGLQVADDAETNSVMLHALDRLMDLPIDRLMKQLLDADFFRDLINPDPVRSLLGWLDDPSGFRPRFDEAQWSAFIQQCGVDYDFDPTTEGPITAAQKLSQRKGAWAQVWKRFAETPELYPGIPDRLRQAKPMELSFEHSETWPQDNESAEDALRADLVALVDETATATRTRVLKLEEAHGLRRGWVWAGLGLAPLAFAIEQLALLAELTTNPLTGDDVSTVVAGYSDAGWRTDDAFLRALGSVTKPADRKAVSVAAAAMYRPWLETGANALQAAIGPMASAVTYQAGPPVLRTKGAVTLFVDGLRLDLAHLIHDRLASAGLGANISTSLSALPTVTQTTKPALVPVQPGSLVAGPDFYPANAATGTKATIQVLRALMIENDVQILGAHEYGNPSGTAWTEAGEVDRRGHDAGIRLVDYIDEELERVVVRIRELLDTGWERVDVVTDHGWILLPGGMEKVELPVATTDAKKGRCARLKDGATVATPTVPWFWDKDVRIALAPGVTCFEANKEYEHGGVSPQECIVPRLTVTAGAIKKATGGPEITKIKWLHLLCRIEFAGVSGKVTVDLRALPANPKTSIAEEAKETGGAGKVSLLVPDEEHEGERAHLVLVA
ncbi:MAG TPA: BREX-1 system phosphatase PglZ type B, partial [Acidimicrobiia bacterium]|nr:BREX-1 system phosphatase PglZ type B [Acidimicrobiia bacterium]